MFFFWLINKFYEKTMKVGLLIILNIYKIINWLKKPDQSNSLHIENYWRSTLKAMAPWGLNVEDCLRNRVLLYSYHWIYTDCNKDLTYGNDFGASYYCCYFDHYHCCYHFYYSFVFIVAISVIVLVFLLSLLLVLVWLSPLSFSFL